MPSSKDYQERILADRYARKDTDAVVQVGDKVVVSMQRRFDRDGEEIESRELGFVTGAKKGEGEPLISVKLIDHSKPEDKWEVVTDLPRHRVEVLIEKCYEDICARVADGVIEKEPENQSFREAVYNAMVKRDFIPAGRILAGLGCKDRTLTFFNCYVFPPPHDSREGIANHWKSLFNTFSVGGGVGWDNSSHRPRGAVVRKVNGRSSGAVSWIEQYSQITGAVEQGGSRRGAALAGLWCWHPDVIEFIQAKSLREEFIVEGKKISRSRELLKNANVSVLISDSFMEAVKRDEDWELVFPDIDHPAYNKDWDGDLDKWRLDGKPIKVYKVVKAKWLWQLIIDHAWASGEPGILFMERANKLSNSYYYNKLSCTNPCAEQVLPIYAVCNLGHINLSQLIRNGVEQLPSEEISWKHAIESVDREKLHETVGLAVRFLDNVTDLNTYHMKENENQQLKERRVGVGILGYGELLVRLGLRYGSENAIKFTDWLFREFAYASYEASMLLAQERGAFPKCIKEKYVESGFMKVFLQEYPQLKQNILEHGVRTVTCNTIAPTGSTATLLNTTTGIEPHFLPAWVARSRIGAAEEEASVLTELRNKFGSNLPEYFVTTQDITPEEHVKTQATAQKWIDASISKTVNLPNSATRDDVGRAYMMLYDMGCKGGTVYRDGSRDRQVLYYKEDQRAHKAKEEAPVVVTDKYKGRDGIAILRPKIDSGLSVTLSKETPVGRLHGTIRFHPKTGAPYDMFLVSGKGDISADVQALGRLISVILRMPDGEVVPQEARLEIIRDQLHRIPGRGQVGFGPDKVMSLPDGVAQLLHEYLSGNFPMANVPVGEDQVEGFLNQVGGGEGEKADTDEVTAWIMNEGKGLFDEEEEEMGDIVGFDFDICPKCGSATYVNIPGKCPHCVLCMHTEC